MRRWQPSGRMITGMLALVLIVAGCAPVQPAASGAVGSGGSAGSGLATLRMAGEDFGYPQPFTFSRGPGHVLMTYVFDTLIWHDREGLIPWLATDWKTSADGKTWTFSLRPGVKWHDGKPLTADDVVFSFRYFKEKQNAWWASQLQLVESVQKEQDGSVAITTTRPYAPFLTQIAASIVIIPKHIWESVDEPAKFTEPTAVVGTGPYRLSQHDRSQGAYLFEANPDFFLGEPYVKRLELVPVSNELLALQQGQIDAGSAGNQDVATDEVLAPFRSDERFGLVAAPREWTVGLYFNLGRGGALADARFRQAVATAIDFQDLVNRVLQGKGAPGNPGHVAPTSPWYNPNVQGYPHDPARAQQLLTEAGYVDRDGDGVRDGPDGTPLRFELIYSDWDSPRNPELLRSYLRTVGVELVPRAMDRNARDAAATEGRYEMILVGFGGLGNDPDNLRQKFHSQSPSRSFTRAQGYQNPRLDELAQKQLVQLETAERKQTVDEIQAILAKDLPMISLYYPEEVWIYRRNGLEDWYFASGWYGGGTNGSYKHLFVTGRDVGTEIRQ